MNMNMQIGSALSLGQDQLLHISSSTIFLGFWVLVLSFFFYSAHAVAPGVSLPLAAGQAGLGRERLGTAASGLAYGGFALLTLGLGARWAAQGYWPVTNAYEAPVAFSWMIVAIYLIAERTMRTRLAGWAALLFVMGLSGYALFNFGASATVIDPLRPALQSNWLRIHVGFAMISYSDFALAAALGLTYLVRSGAWRSPRTASYAPWPLAVTLAILFAIYIGRWPGSGGALSLGKGLGIALESLVLLMAAYLGRRALVRRPGPASRPLIPGTDPEPELLGQLDEWSYRAIAIGVPLMAFVLMSGAIWAQLAWSTFWSWDPKEVWALITFAYYVVYIHVRVQRGWRGAPMAALAVVGFLAVIVSFLGLAYIVGTMQIFSLHTFGNVQ